MRFDRCIAMIIAGFAAVLAGCKDGAPASAIPEVGLAGKGTAETPPAATPIATITQRGFITMRDGIRLRYVVKRPDTATRVPLILNYNPYNAGSDPGDNGVANLEPELIRRGYAVAGLQARGTGCSEGEFGIFDQQIGRDGYDAIEWLADQDWSDGRVGMAGHSAGGMTQLYVAGQRPPHLRAIVPHAQLGDIYRDLAYPGGIPEYAFPAFWTFAQKAFYAAGPASDPEPECLEIYAKHEPANVKGDNFVPFLFLDHPYVDDDGAWPARAPNANFPRINVPTFILDAWQDEQLAGRIFDSLERFRHPERLWVNFGNGNHGRAFDSQVGRALMLDFLDRFVRDVDNGFEDRVAHVTLAMEVIQGAAADPTYNHPPEPINQPSWDIGRKSLHALKPKPRSLYLQSGGELGPAPDFVLGAGDSYAYPMPSASVLEPALVRNVDYTGLAANHIAWKAPVPPGGSLAYTTEPLASDLVVAGPASLDLWMTSTATDTDIQATVTEVRPDGQELYVQRGWLRASHRKLDPKLTTELRPWHTHLRADAEPLAPGPNLLRVEIFPFAQAFRKGSRIRVWIDAPTGQTGLWAFMFNPEPATNTILHDAAHPSRLVLGVLEEEVARTPMPACDTLRNQPCRMDPLLK